MKRKKNKESIQHTKTFKYGIQFASLLEVYCYEQLKLSEYADKFKYTPFSIDAIDEKKINLISLHPRKKSSKWKKGDPIMKVRKGETLQSISYTPDFIVELDNHRVIIETKGYANDAFPIRKKLFKVYLDEQNKTSDKQWVYCEPSSHTEIKETIEFLNTLK